MKRTRFILLCLIVALSLSACSYNPPEGWTQRHHPYQEALAFAQSIDPNATVAEAYTDSVDEYGWEYREWEAIIHGVHCHVASVSDWVWNDGLAAGEFVKTYYRLDTDYDYMVMQTLLCEKYPDWQLHEGIRSRYHNHDVLYVALNMPEYRLLSDDELEQVWQTALAISLAFEQLAVDRKACFGVPSPAEYWNHHGEQASYVKNDSCTYIDSFTDEGKQAFLQEYQEAWALLESTLPVYD